MVDDISHEGLRVLLREEGVSFQVIKTWKQSNDPDFEAKKNRVLELYDIADGKAKPKKGDPTVVICMDEFGPLNLLAPARQAVGAEDRQRRVESEGPRRRRRRATYTRTKGVRHLMAAYDLNQDKIYGHIKTKKDRTTFLEFCRYLRTLYPPEFASPSCWTTSARICRPRETPGSATGPRPTTSSWPTCPPTPAG